THQDGAFGGDAYGAPRRPPSVPPRHAYVIETTIGSSVAVRPSGYDHLHNPDTPVQAPRPTGFTPEQLRAELDELTRETRKRRGAQNNRQGGRQNNQQNQNQGGNRQNQGNQNQGNPQNNQQHGNQQQQNNPPGGNRQQQGGNRQQQQQNNQLQGGANQQAQQRNVGAGAQQVAPVPGQAQQRGPGPTWADLIDTRVQRHIFTGDPVNVTGLHARPRVGSEFEIQHRTELQSNGVYSADVWHRPSNRWKEGGSTFFPDHLTETAAGRQVILESVAQAFAYARQNRMLTRTDRGTYLWNGRDLAGNRMSGFMTPGLVDKIESFWPEYEEPYPSQVPNRWIPPVQPQALRLAQPRRVPVPDRNVVVVPDPRNQPSHNQAAQQVPVPAPVQQVHQPTPQELLAAAKGAVAELWSLEEPPSVGDVALHV